MKHGRSGWHLDSVNQSSVAQDAVAVGHLLDRLASRDVDAFTRLVALFDRDLARVAFIVAQDREAARDAVQATWERVWRDPPVLRAPQSLRGWLLAVASNEARQASRRERRAAAREERFGWSPSQADPSSGIEFVDLAGALRELDPPDRELLALRYVLELTSQEIATHLGISPEGVRSRLHRLVNRLREELSNA